MDNASPIQFTPFNINTGSNLPYQFLGMDRVQSGSALIVGYGFSSAAQVGLTCVGSRCPASCLTSQACIANGGTLTSTTCFLCASGEIVSNGQCISQNPCGANMHLEGNSCVCDSGFILISSVCYRSCGTNAIIMNSQCQCIPGYTYSNTYNQCVPTSSQCAANYIYYNGQCICPSPYCILNGECVPLPGNSYRNQTGYCTCNIGYTYSTTAKLCLQNTPQCQLPYVLSNG